MLDVWHLENIDCLRVLEQDDQELLCEAANTFRCASGELVFEPTPNPHHVYILETGLIKIFRESAHADEAILGYVRPPEVFGELTLFSSKPRESYAQAVVDCSGLKIPSDLFRQVLQHSASATYVVATQIGGRFKEVESRVEDLVFRNVRSRLARILLQLNQSFGEKVSGRNIIQRRFTHKDLAALTGASRPSISLAMGEMEDAGLISRAQGQTIIEDLEQLEAISAALT